MPPTILSGRFGCGRFVRVDRRCSDDRTFQSHAARFSRLMLLAIGGYFCSGLVLWAQISDSQTDAADKSWTATSESGGANVNPTRTTESHTQSGNRTFDKQSVQVRGLDGHFQPYQDVEKETVQVDATTLRTTIRMFARDAEGVKILVQSTEEEKHALPGGDSNVVRTTTTPDVDGRLQLVQRQVEETKRISRDVEETNTTVMLPSVDGALAPAARMQERRKRDGNDKVESQTTTLIPDGSGNWKVGEIRQASITEEGMNRNAEEQISRPDSEGKTGEVSRTVSEESVSTSGEKRNTVETYSVDVPGSARDGSIHLIERATTTQRLGATGQRATEQRVEQPNPGDPGSGLRVTTLTTDTIRSSAFGVEATHTVQAYDANGSFGVVSIDTTKSDNIHAIQVQIAPSENPD